MMAFSSEQLEKRAENETLEWGDQSKWSEEIKVNGMIIKFQLNKGADVIRFTVVSSECPEKHTRGYSGPVKPKFTVWV